MTGCLENDFGMVPKRKNLFMKHSIAWITSEMKSRRPTIMRRPWLWFAALWVAGPVWAAPTEPIDLTTAHYQVSYAVRAGGELELVQVKSRDGSWRAPFGGLVFSADPAAGTGNTAAQPDWVSIRKPGGAPSAFRYESHSAVNELPGVEHVTIRLRDQADPVRLELHFRVHAATDVIEQWQVLANDMKTPVQVERLDSAGWTGNAQAGVFLEWFDSGHKKEAARPEHEQLVRGSRVIEGRDGNRHLLGPLPAFVLGFGKAPDESSVPCVVAALAWSGNARLSFEVNDHDSLRASAGVSHWGMPTIEPGKTMASPACVYAFSAAGKGAASRGLHRWMRQYGLRDGDRLRLVDNNSWEGCKFGVSEGAIVEMLRRSAELGIELYVLDDGWFGNGPDARINSRSGLGDWQVNRRRFPSGLAPVIAAAAENKIAFGLWFEPEMVNPRSQLFKDHPDWVMRVPGEPLKLERYQAVLDLANPAVQDFVFHVVDDALNANPGIRFIKWDANSSLNNPYSPYLGADRQGDLIQKYMEGYYAALEKVVRKHPGVDFQACSAGGGRADLGALRFSHTFWPSDNTDPAYRLGAQWNYSTFLAPISMTCHVTHAGEKRIQPKYRFDVSMMGQLGMEVDPRKSKPEYIAAAKVGIAAYKQVRDVIQLGDQYRHRSPFESATPSLNCVSADQARAVVIAYQTGDIREPVTVVAPVAGLDAGRLYRLSEINLPPGDDHPRLAPGTETSKPGSEWMKDGVPLVFTRKFDSAALVLEAK